MMADALLKETCNSTILNPISVTERGIVELSVIIPTFNEIENVGELVRRLEPLLQGIAWEVIFVDDDSPDVIAHLPLAGRVLSDTMG